MCGIMHNCYNCSNLDPEKKSKGKLDGALYFCKKNKIFINAAKDGCDKWSKADRKSYKNDEYYDDGRKYYNDNNSVSFYLFILVIVIILCAIASIMGK